MPPAPTVDHFTFIRNYERLIELFTKELGLPLVWPFSDFGTFESAAVQAGNLLFEMARPKFPQPSDYAVTLLAGERLSATLARLAQLGLRHQVPWRMDLTYPCPWTVPHRDLVDGWLLKRGGTGVRWEVAAIPEVLPQAVGLLVADYHLDFHELGEQSRAAVRTRSNRPDALGWLDVKSLMVSVSADTQSRRAEQLHKLMGEHGGLEYSNARIVLMEGPSDGFAGIVARVRSLARARRFLASRDLLGSTSERHVSVAAWACPDFELRFEAAESA